MKPDFALTLSFEGISLLRRVSNGWALVGDVALDAADLRAALADLRNEADALSATGGQVKLVVPNEQIKYLTLPDTGQSEEDLQSDIRQALDGATPYAVDDLSFDCAIAHGQVFVAAVANETLDEAEAFAKSHHFEPVSFAAIAADGDFEGEVFFGKAASWTGAAPNKDADAIVIVPPEQIVEPTDDVPPVDADLTEPKKDDISIQPAVVPDARGIEDDGLAPGAADPSLDNDTPVAPRVDIAPEASDLPTFSSRKASETPSPSFASIRASRAQTPPPPPPSAAVSLQADPKAPAPRFKLGGARKSTRDSDVTAPGLQVDATEATPDRKGFGFFSRRPKKDAPDKVEQAVPPLAKPAPSVDPTPAAPQIKPAHDSGPARAAVARIAAMRAGRVPEQNQTDAAVLPDERQRMTVFGARTEPQIGGKPRFLGLMLTSALLIVLLAVAAWASVFMDEGISRFFDRNTDTPSIARLPDVELQPLDGSVTAPSNGNTVQLASLNGDEATQPDTGGLSVVLPPPAALTPEEAAAKYAATGIWQKSPNAPAAPSMTSLDDLYVASIDGRVQQFDAVALPNASTLRNDETYLSLTNPPVPGSRYNLDDRGLVIATPEGAVNPEGVRIFAGLPPVVPPTRPAPPEVIPEPTEGATTVVSALAQFRPRPRPSGLVESNERATLGGSTRAELAAFRPSARPATLKSVEENAQPEATKFAVAQSVEPVTRPRNFSRIVARAKEIQKSQQTQVTQVAAVAPRSVKPRIPSSANVARQATMKNAINLRRINLIGVYGKTSSRRALVRLSNGRYKKVAVGDRLDGGRVAAIGNSELRYTKNGRNVVLDMPDG